MTGLNLDYFRSTLDQHSINAWSTSQLTPNQYLNQHSVGARDHHLIVSRSPTKLWKNSLTLLFVFSISIADYN